MSNDYWILTHTWAKCCTHTRKTWEKPEFSSYDRLFYCTTLVSLTFHWNLLKLFSAYFESLSHSFSRLCCVHTFKVSSFNEVLERMNRFLQGLHDLLPQEFFSTRLLVGPSGSFFSCRDREAFRSLLYDFRPRWQLPLSLAQVKRAPIRLVFCQIIDLMSAKLTGTRSCTFQSSNA